jgi:hypothetical protein
VSLYAIEPRGYVTLELIDPAGATFVFHGWTAQEAIDRAFPTLDFNAIAKLEEDKQNEDHGSVFD